MSKTKLYLPRLFQRGKKKQYYFRMHVDGKDKWICTNTDNLDAATENAKAIISAQNTVKAMVKTDVSANNLAQTFVRSITGKDVFSMTLTEAHAYWVSLTPEFSDLIAQSQRTYEAIFKHFVNWCTKNGYSQVADIDYEAALRYAKYLWDSNITPRTYNGHLKQLSRVFAKIDAIHHLPYRNPFDNKKIQRKKQVLGNEAGHLPLEPKILQDVIAEAAKISTDFRDLFIIGSQTGMRLKDVVLLQWENINDGFIDLKPHKTMKSGNRARIPISSTLQKVLDTRAADNGTIYVFPDLAEHYQKNESYILKRSQTVFESVLGKDKTKVAAGKNRRRNTSVYSFHSFRTTFMSMLAAEDVSTRDAMRIMGWESPEMIKVYEKMLDKARGDADRRATALIDRLDGLKITIPEIPVKVPPARPSLPELTELIKTHSNVEIANIYKVSETAVRKWRNKLA